jgi:RHS repeat-associated protein
MLRAGAKFRLARRWLVIIVSAALMGVELTTVTAAPALADTRTSVTSYDRTAPGAPHNGYFDSAWQSFVARSDTITTVGVTVGTPNYVPDGHTITIKLCTDPACSTTLASASPQIVNYGSTQVDLGDIGVTPGTIYYLVWYQPAAWNGQTWVTYWWSGGSSVTTSDQMQGLVLGYDRGPQVDRTAVTSYNQMQPGAPYNGYFVSAWQAFTSQSNTITTLGVTVGSPGYTGSGSTVRIRLCGDPNCHTAYGETDPPIVNFGYSQGDIGDVSVTPGATYYIVYSQPAAWSGHTWITYWWSGGPTIQQSDQMQAIVQGYNRSTPVPPTFYVAGTGGIGLTERSGPGLTYGSAGSLLEGQQIQISCQQQSGSAVGGSDIWDQLANGNWVSDFYTTTPVYAGFSPGIRQCSSPPPPPPVTTSYRVYDTGGLGLNERTGPGLAFPGVGALPSGGTVDIACQWRSGSYANGSSIWDQLGNGTWVADGYVTTPQVNQFTPGIPQCASAPSAPSYAYPIPQSYGRPGSTPYGHNPTSVTADPVNTLTGAYWTQATDLRLPGIGVPFALTRAYTSINRSGGPFGPGWTFSYQMQLTQSDKGDLTLQTDQGAQLAFQMESTGLFVGAPGVNAILRQTPTGFEVVRNDQTHLFFDTAGHLQAILDRNGQGLHMTDDAAGNLTRITDSAGRVITFGYDPGTTLITSVTLPDGRSVHYGYTSGLLTTVTDPAGGKTIYSYDSADRLTSIVDPNGHTRVSNVYGAGGRVTAQTDALGHTSTFAWNPATSTSTMTDARGGTWQDIYSNNVLAARIDPLGDKTTYTYDGDLNLTSVTDANGNTTSYTYDIAGNEISQTDPAPLSYAKTWTYDALNDLTKFVDGRGHATTYGYDANGNRISMTAPGGQLTRYGRDPGGTGLLVSQTDPDGHTTTYGYDSGGNKIRQTSPLGEVTTWTYDGSGRMTSVVDPRGNISGANPGTYRTSYRYDALDRLTKVTDPLGHATTTAYDPVGNKTRVADANGRTTTYGYDAADHLTSVTDALGYTTSYSYDATGNLVSRTDPNGHKTRYQYDAANRLTQRTDPLGRVTAYQHDANGNLTRATDANGVVTTNTYDVLNRRTATSYSGSTHGVTLTYDADGNRTGMTDAGGSVSYTYDAENELRTSSRGTATFTYTYDAAGHITSRTYPGSPAISDRYDADGRLTSVTAAGNTTTFGYDPAGNQTTKTLPGAHRYTETRTFDAANRIIQDRTAAGTTVLANYAYTRDGDGSPTRVSGSDGPFYYTYDADNRLTKVCFGSSTCSSSITWTYDKVGNRHTEQRSGKPMTAYTYDAADEMRSATGSSTTTYHYDADGNETAAGARTVSYDATGHIKSTSSGGTATSFVYDGDGNRIQSTTGTVVTHFLWDTNNPLPMLALTRNAAGSLLQRYTYGLGEPISLTVPTATYYLTGDALGSITGVTSATGTPLIRYSYEPFGLNHNTTNLATTGRPSSEPLRFTGQYLDTFGLYDLRAREYDPSTGRFTSQDPIAAAPADPYLADYLYASDNPITGIDPSGQSWLDTVGLVLNGVPGVPSVRSSLDTAGLVLNGIPKDLAGFAGTEISAYDVHSDCNGQLSSATNCGFSLAGYGAGLLGLLKIIPTPAGKWIGAGLTLFTPDAVLSK